MTAPDATMGGAPSTVVDLPIRATDTKLKTQKSSIGLSENLQRRRYKRQDQLRDVLAEIGFQLQPEDVRQRILQIMQGASEEDIKPWLIGLPPDHEATKPSFVRNKWIQSGSSEGLSSSQRRTQKRRAGRRRQKSRRQQEPLTEQSVPVDVQLRDVKDRSGG